MPSYHGYSERTVPDRSKDLPNFSQPPVHEVLLAVQFDALTEFHSYHVGKLWDRVRDRYPNVQEQPPLNVQFETFGVAEPAAPAGAIEIQALLSPPMVRYWFEAGEDRLMQVQQDRLIHNWRKGEGQQEYPRYEKVLEEFLADYRVFSDFVREERFGEIRINQCEIAYINSIFIPGTEDPYTEVERVMKVWNRPTVSIGVLEQATVQPRFILSKNGQPYARLHVTLQPAIRRSTRQPCLQLTLSVKGKPADESLDASIDFFAEGRDAIVKVFADLTTPEMHKQWGRIDG